MPGVNDILDDQHMPVFDAGIQVHDDPHDPGRLDAFPPYDEIAIKSSRCGMLSARDKSLKNITPP